MAQVPKLDTKLPSNARLLTHANQCYDWGTFGWLLRSGEVNVQKYKYFVLLNSSVRGPFLPPYVPVGLHIVAKRQIAHAPLLLSSSNLPSCLGHIEQKLDD